MRKILRVFIATHFSKLFGAIRNYDVLLAAIFGRIHEPELRKISMTKNGMVIIDVGANLGQSITSFTCLTKKPIIHSFECNPKCISMLNITAKINSKLRRARCYVYTNALSQEESHLNFIIPTHNNIEYLQEGYLEGTVIDVQAISDRIGCRPNELTYTEITVHTRRLDSFNLKPKLIKIDVQGAELSVLKGAVRTIELNKPELFIEKPDNSNNEKELINFINNVLSYKIIRIGTNWLCIAV